MINRRVGELSRKLRHRGRITQQALAQRCGVPRWKIGRFEAGDLAALRFGEAERILAALGAELEVRGRYRGAAADRLVDEGHATMVARVVRLLREFGWEVRVEVSFNEWGERGSYDILAFHARLRALLVVEVKTELASVEETLRILDVKVRLAPAVARRVLGWRTEAVGRALVLPEARGARRAVTRHAEVLRTALPATSRQLHSWLRAPTGAIAAIWFISAPGGRSWTPNPSSIRRVRLAGAQRRPAGDPANVLPGQH
jgi:transcriptional regulator with XRE-family HTH domain